MKMFNGCLGRGLLVVLALGLIGWCLWSWFAPTAVVRYRLDVTLEVDGKPVTGSVVQELVVSTWPLHLPGNARVGYQLHGQALRLDLADRGVLYVLMERPAADGKFTHSDYGNRYERLVPQACRVELSDENFGVYVRSFKRLTGTCIVPPELTPLMVRFEDELDQTSITRVFPDNMESTLGLGVNFVGASVTITVMPLVFDIGEHLPWLSDNIFRRLGTFSKDNNNKFYRDILDGSFRRVPQ